MTKYKVRPDSKVQAAADQYKAWREKHELEHASRMQKLKRVAETDSSFFAKQAKKIESQRREVEVSAGIPKPTSSTQRRVSGIDKSNMTLEELDLLKKREEAAQVEIERKKARTGPVYNKGNYVFLSDDLLKDVQAGNTRRRP